MEATLQIVMQTGALGLLAYLIWWVTQTGAPQLFTCLTNINGSLNTIHGRLEKVEDEVKELRREVEARRGE